MMTDSQKSFVKIKLWFTQLVNLSSTEQLSKIKELTKDATLDEKQIKILKGMLQADQETEMVTNIDSISEKIINEVSNQNITFANKQIGHYQIIKPLGEGGMGHVYLAQRNDGTFEQQVALKFPHFNFNQSMKQRFENERQILAQLTHENIARLLDGGTTDNNQPYLVMEYIKGATIDDYCVKQIPDLSKRINLILQICQAVTFSHQQLILHRDLKPSNILVTEDGQVKLLDFGIAKLLDLDDEAKAKNTATQIMTRYYASPEQLKGKPASTHSDLFSLAIIAYELITGFHPFQHKDQHEREQILISGKIMRVTQRTEIGESIYPELATIPSGKIQGDLENILLKALSVDPDKRYESVKDFANDLLNFIKNKPISARRPSTVYYINKWVQRHKAVTFFAMITLMTLIIASLYSHDKAKISLKQKEIAEIESEKSKQVSDFLKSLFKKAKPTSASKQLTAQDLLLQGYKDIEEKTFSHLEIKYELLVIIHKSLISMGSFKESSEIIEKHVNDCQSELSQINQSCIMLILIHSSNYHYQKKWQKSLEQIKKAEAFALMRKPLDHDELAGIYLDMHADLIRLGKLKEAENYLSKVIEIEKKSDNPDTKRIINTMHNLALNFIWENDFLQAKSYLDKIPSYIEKIKNTDQPYWLGAHYGIMSYYFGSQKLAKESYEYRQKRVDLMESSYELLPQGHGEYLKNAAAAARRAGLIETSEDLLNRAYDFYVNNVTNNDKFRLDIIIEKVKLYFHLKKNSLLEIELSKLEKLIEASDDVEHHVKFTYDLGKLYLKIDILSDFSLKKELDILVNKFANKSKSYPINTRLLEARIYIKLREIDKANSILIELTEQLDKYPNDYLTYKVAFKNLAEEITKLQPTI